MELSPRTRHARALFAPLGPSYDRYARLLSFGQDPRWRAFLVSRVPADARRVLDVATGTAAVAIELARAEPERTVVGVDQSAEMLAVRASARRAGGPDGRVELREGRAEELAGEGEFDALTFTYLLRYVDDPAATLCGLARGGEARAARWRCSSSPCRAAPWRPLWELYVRVGLPLAGRLVSPGWHEVGRFLGPSIRGFWERLARAAAPRALARGRDRGRAGAPTQPRRRDRRLGPARVSGAARPAFYALRPGGWRDYATLAPRAVHALAPLLRRDRGRARAADGLAAARLDDARLRARDGRSARTRSTSCTGGRSRRAIPGGVLVALAALSVAGACAIGIAVAASRTWWLLAFVAAGAFLVVAYNLELLGGAFHGDLWFADAWGAFPVLTAYFASARTLRREALAAAAFAFLASWAQRRLSTQVRLVRRRLAGVEGEARLLDGETLPVDAGLLADAPEAALKALAAALVLLAGALLLARAG